MISTGFVQLLSAVYVLLWNIQGEEVTLTEMQWSLCVTYFFLHFFALHKLCTLTWRPASWFAGNKTPAALSVGSCRAHSTAPVPMTSTWCLWWGQLQTQTRLQLRLQFRLPDICFWCSSKYLKALLLPKKNTAGEKKFLNLTAPFPQNYWI